MEDYIVTWKIILSQDIWWAAAPGSKQLFRSHHHHGHTPSTKLSIRTLHLKCHWCYTYQLGFDFFSFILI